MKIETVKKQSYNGEFSGYLVNGNTFFPKENCELIKQWLAEGNEPEAEFTEKEIQKQAETKAIYDRKYVGIEYTNLRDEVYIVSLTNDDANGLIQVKTAFETGIAETNFYFENGTIVPLKSIDDLLHLGQFVSIERNKFFLW